MGLEIEMGSCFTAKYASVQETPTMSDFKNNAKCSAVVIDLTRSISSGTVSFDIVDHKTNGIQIAAHTNAFMYRTGATGLSRTDIFFATS